MPQHIVTTSADSGAGSLRAAIAQAQSGDTITLASSLAGATLKLQSQLELSPGQNITLDGGTAPGFTIDGGQKHRLLQVNSNHVNPTKLTVKNLTLANGYTPERGGAIATTHQGEVAAQNVQFKNNVADKGGGAIFTAFEGRLTVLDSDFTGNRATAANDERGAGAIAFWGPRDLVVKGSTFVGNEGINGGAINSLNGKLTIEDTLFRDNKTTAAKYDSGNPRPFLRGFGGAIYTDRASTGSDSTSGTIRITGSTFEGNQGRGEGGAAYLYTGTQDRVIIEDSRFEDNRVIELPGGGNGGNGGAVVQMNNGLNRGFTVTNTLFAGNTATGQGGGIWAMDADTSITNSTFSGNRTLGQTGSSVGGGLALYSPTDIVDSTFADNQAGWVGGAIAASKDDRVTVKSTIFSNNTADNGPNDWGIQQHTSRELVDLGNNIQYPPKQTNNFNDYNATASIRTDIDPQLSPLQPSGVHLVGNPAVSAGAQATGSLGSGQSPAAPTEEMPAPAAPTPDSNSGDSDPVVPEETPDTDSINSTTNMSNTDNGAFEQDVLRLTNAFRSKQGLAPLTLNQKLAEAAEGHSEDMATQDFFSHTGKDGDKLSDRVKQVDYGYRAIGENIAAGQATPEAVVEAWKTSPGHRANLLNAQFTEIGVGYYHLENDTGRVNYNRYWTQVFGKPSGTPTPPTSEDTAPPVAAEPDVSQPKPEAIPPQAEGPGSEGPEPNGIPQPDAPDPQTENLQPNAEAELEVSQPEPQQLEPQPEPSQSEAPQIDAPRPETQQMEPQVEPVEDPQSSDALEPDMPMPESSDAPQPGQQGNPAAEGESPQPEMIQPEPEGGTPSETPMPQPGDPQPQPNPQFELEPKATAGEPAAPEPTDSSPTTPLTPDGFFAEATPSRPAASPMPAAEAMEGSAAKSIMQGGSSNDEIRGTDGDDWLQGNQGNDRLWGKDGNDDLYGNGGSDWLQGDSGLDRLFGGAGEDTLVVSTPEADRLFGDTGSDRFVLGYGGEAYNPADNNRAVILDFNAAEGDRLVLIGEAEQYRLGSAASDGYSGTSIFAVTPSSESTLIAISKERVTLADVDFVASA